MAIHDTLSLNANKSTKIPEFRRFNRITTILILLLPLGLSEKFIATSAICQWVISSITSLVPGIAVISQSSRIPQMVALEMSIGWLLIALFIILNLYRALWIKRLFIRPTYLSPGMFVFAYFGLIVFIAMETSGFFSFYYGTVGIFHPDSNLFRNSINMFIQTKIGVLITGYIEVIWLQMILIGLVIFNVELVKKLTKRSKPWELK